MNFDLDNLIFFAFLSLNLAVGLFFGRKVKTLKDYALGGKNFATPVLTATVVATWASGSMFAAVLENVYEQGLYYVIAIIGNTLVLLLMSKFLIMRMGEFMDSLSVAESMGKLYGEVGRRLTALCGLTRGVGLVSGQFIVASKLLVAVFGLEHHFAIFCAAGIVIAYSTLGGIRSVTFTDVFQFFMFGVLIPYLGLQVWHKVGSVQTVYQSLSNSDLFSPRLLFQSPRRLISCFALFLYFAFPDVGPSLFQRTVMARDVQQAKTAFAYAFWAYFLVVMVVIGIATLMWVNAPGVMQSGGLEIALTYGKTAGFKGFFAAGLMAMVLSTADSHLNSSAVLLINDFVGTPKAKAHLIYTKLATLSLGLTALALALRMQNLLEIALLASSLYMPLITVPLLLAIFGFRTNKRPFYIGSATALVTTLAWRFLPVLKNTGINNVIPGMLANTLAIFASHYLLREGKGWVGIADTTPLDLEQQARQHAAAKAAAVRRGRHWRHRLEALLPHHYGTYTRLGIYIIIALYLPLYMLPKSSYSAHQLGLYCTIILTLSTCFIAYPAWQHREFANSTIRFAWPIGICALFFILSPTLITQTHGHPLQILLYALHCGVALYVLPWRLVFFSALSGLILVHYAWAPLPLEILAAHKLATAYGMLLTGILFSAIARARNRRNDLLKSKLRAEAAYQGAQEELMHLRSTPHRFVQHLQRSTLDVLGPAQTLSEKLAQSIQNPLEKVDIPRLQENFETLTLQIQAAKRHLARSLDLAHEELTFNKKLICSTKFLAHLKDKLSPEHNALLHDYAKKQDIQVDVARMQKVLLATLANVRTGGALYAHLSVYDAFLKYPQHDNQEYHAIAFAISPERPTNNQQSAWPKHFVHLDIAMNHFGGSLRKLQHEVIVAEHYGYVHRDGNNTILIIPRHLAQMRPETIQKVPSSSPLPESAQWVGKATEAHFWDCIAAHAPQQHYNLPRLERAVEFMKSSHAHQQRRAGEPYYTHPFAVAIKLASFCANEDALLAALLHDTVEDTDASGDELTLIFGPKVWALVKRLSNLHAEQKRFNLADTGEKVAELINAARTGKSEIDKTALLIKLCDRWHNLITLQAMSPEKQRKTSVFTQEVYVPLARELGWPDLAQQLSDLARPYLNDSKAEATSLANQSKGKAPKAQA